MVGYREASVAALSGVVDPNSEHRTLDPGGAWPLSVETGTSTAGRAHPADDVAVSCRGLGRPDAVLASRNGGGEGGGVPWATHLSKAANAAWTTGCCGPSLMGWVQPRAAALLPTR